MATTITTQENITLQKADCKACLTKSCPLNNLDNSPVTLCNTFRLANCALCGVSDCPLNGTVNSPVLNCSSFQLLAAA